MRACRLSKTRIPDGFGPPPNYEAFRLAEIHSFREAEWMEFFA